MIFFINEFKRAPLTSALFLFFSFLFLTPKAAEAASVKNRSTIKRATELLMKNERLRAVKFIRKELRKAQSNERAHLEKLHKKIASYFITSKSLKKYEKAKVLFRMRNKESLSVLTAALELEPWNYLLNRFKVEQAIYFEECKLILPALSKLLAIDPKYRSKNKILMAYSSCTGDLEAVEREIAKSENKPLGSLYFVWLKFKQGDLKSSCSHAREAIQKGLKIGSELIYSLAWQSCSKKEGLWAEKLIHFCRETPPISNYLIGPCNNEKLLEQMAKTRDSSSI